MAIRPLKVLLPSGVITGATQQAQQFTSGVISPKLYPSSDSTTALQLNKADGTTNVVTIDTVNGRFGIGTTSPLYVLDIIGSSALWQSVYSSDDGLVLYFPFSENISSTAYDRSPNGYDGTISGASWSAGKYGYGLSFNGTSSNVEVSNESAFDFSDTTFSIEAWFKTSGTGIETLVSKGGFTQGYVIRLNGGALEVFLKGNGNSMLLSSSATYNDNNWHHIVAVITTSTTDSNANNIIGYIDGVSIGILANYGRVYVPNNYNFAIGYRNESPSGTYFSGSIDEVKVYSRALSADEVKTHYLRGKDSGLIVSDKFRVINTSATELLRVTSTGNVGIGETAPGSKLSVSGGATIGASYDTTAAPTNGILIEGNVGMGTTSPTNLLSLGGNSARTFWMERHTTANTAGNILTVQAGGATSGATDKAGGDLILQPGVSTGSAESGVQIKGCVAGVSGTVDRTITTAIQVLGNKIGIFSQTPAVQQSHIADPSGGATIDAESRTAINAILLALETFGWFASS